MKKATVIFTIFLLLQSSSFYAQDKKQILGSSLRMLPQQESGTPLHSEANPKTLYFNFNPVIDFSAGKFDQKYKGLVKNESSVFVVFKSGANEENGVLLLDRAGHKVIISNQHVTSGNEVRINKGNPKTGIVVSYFNSINSIPHRKKGNIAFDDFFYADNTGKNQIMELIYIPKLLSPTERDMVESYLSVAYGISQESGENYLDSQGKETWSSKENGSFGFRVTGIGRDDAFGLYQKQSQNSEGDGIVIGVGKISKSNLANDAEIENRNFLLWGDNGQSLDLDQQSGNITSMKRLWKAQPRQSITTQIRANLQKMPTLRPDDQKQQIWLVVDTLSGNKINYDTAQYISPTLEGDELVFDNVRWNQPSVFSFVKAPAFFVSKDVVSGRCETGQNGKLTIRFFGGKAPYTARVSGSSYDKTMSVSNESVDFEDLPSGNYTIEASDSRGLIVTDSFTTDGFPSGFVALRDKWEMHNAGIHISADVMGHEEGISFRWTYNGQTVSVEKEFFATTPGLYQLIVKNPSGCEKTFVTEVIEKTAYNWRLFPNPVSVGENFNLQFNFAEPTAVTVVLSDVNGKVLKSKRLGNITKFDYKDSVASAGTYLLQVVQSDVVETAKLIVK